MQITFLQAILLGIVQGLTEFLPVSSSAHLIISSYFLNGQSLPLTFNVALHFGTALAVLIYFWRDWFQISKMSYLRVIKNQSSFESSVLVPCLILGCVPAAVVGKLFEEPIEKYFHNPLSVTAPLIIVGFLLWWFDKKSLQTKSIQNMTLKDSLIIGLAQCLALIPGVSRSGSTIMMGRILQFDRVSAAKYSFLLGTPIIFGAALLKSKAIINSGINHSEFVAGIVVSFISGLIAIKILMVIVQKYSFIWFALYRTALALTIIAIYLQ